MGYRQTASIAVPILAGGVALGTALSLIGLTASCVGHKTSTNTSTGNNQGCVVVARVDDGPVDVYKCRDGRGGYVTLAVSHGSYFNVALTR